MQLTTSNYKNPAWWDTENDSSWERVKSAFRRDWDQTKHDFGGKEPDLNQNVNDTVKQAAGKEAIPPRHQSNYEQVEPAYRYGYGARQHYGEDYPEWDDDLESRLKEEWLALDPARKSFWDSDREAIQEGWHHEEV
jgi:hypothetical protein